MTLGVNELRFNMIEKKPEILSTYNSPKTIYIKSKVKRFGKNDSGKGKDFYLTDKIYDTEQN